MALNSTKTENASALASVLFQTLYQVEQVPKYEDFSILFDLLTKEAQEEPLIFIIDEYPYLAQSYPGISSSLQKYIDHDWKSTKAELFHY